MNAVFGDPVVMRYGDGVRPSEWGRAWVARAVGAYDRDPGLGTWAVVEAGGGLGGAVIGYCGLTRSPGRCAAGEAEVGFRLARAWWGRGFATEAAGAVRDHAFGPAGVDRLIALIDPANVASVRVAEKIGLRYERDVMLDGYDHPDHLYAADRSDEAAVVFRGYTPADWPQVCRVHDLARVQELAAGGVDAGAFRPMRDAAEGDEFFVSETVVACAGDYLVGFVSWNGAYITWLYVDPGWQRRGVGRRLLAESLWRIGPGAWTNLIGGNAAALALYRRAGMEVVWARPGDCDGFPCVGMRLALPTSRMRDPAARRHDGDALPAGE